MEDRHGEMTGAITFNLVFACTLALIWSMYIGPWLGLSMWGVIISGLVIGVLLTLLGVPVSRYLWGHFSAWSDGK